MNDTVVSHDEEGNKLIESERQLLKEPFMSTDNFNNRPATDQLTGPPKRLSDAPKA